MKDYYFEMSNGETDFVEARTDHSAYNKACKIAKKWGANVTHLEEMFEDDEVGRVIF